MAPARCGLAAIPNQWADLGKVALRYADIPGGPGRPLVLLHEMGGSLDSWGPVLSHLAPHRRTILCDMRGAGGSEKIRAPLTMDDFANDIVSLLDFLRIEGPVDIAGIAIGGCIALRVAASHPERVHRAAPINPPVDAVGRSGKILRERAESAETGGMRQVVESALARSWPDHLRTNRSAFEAYAARFICNDPISYAHILRALSDVSFDGLFEKIGCPTVFIAGRDDLVRPPEATRAASEHVEGATFVEIEGGHIASMQAPRAVAHALNDAFSD